MKEFLSRAGYQFTLRLVDEDDAAYDALLQPGCRTVPLTVVGTHLVAGFDSDALARALAAVG